MAVNARYFFGLEKLSDYVLSSMTKTNLDIVGYESIFISFWSTILAIWAFLPIPPWSDFPLDSIVTYRIGLASMAVVCLVLHAVITRVKHMKNRSFVAPLVMLLFIVAVMGISMWITLTSFASTGSLLVYVAALMLLFGVIYLPPIVIIAVLTICTIIMIVGLSIGGQANSIDIANLIVFAFLAAAISLSGYHARLRSTLANEEIHIASIRDELTGVKNRRALDTDAQQFVNSDVRILLGDIDEFKFYNDSFGHAAGDEMLKRFAESMTKAFGEEYVYRYGGDEFVAVMRGAPESEFLEAIDAWRIGFSGIEVDGEVYSPTTSGGFVSGTPKDVDEFQEMLRIADLRLYDSKLAGRNTVLGSVYDERSKAELSSGMQHLRERRSGDSDPLTGLPTITYFYAHAKTVIDSPKLDGANFSIVYFNIANMKAYNERFGMMAGDELLVFVARVLEDAFEHALVARFGDDRFVMLTYGDDLFKGLENVYSRVFSHSDDARTVIQAGVFPYDRHIEVSEACDRAKLACDHIKGDLSMHYCLYNDGLKAERDLKRFIVEHFDEAIEKGHIQVHYQPILRTISKHMSDVEALARWFDPDEGVISPADFIPVLEEFRLIHKLDLRIVELFCMDYQVFANSGRTAVPMSVNLSRYDMELCDIVGEIVAIMERYDVPTYMLNIEIEESTFAQRSDLLRTTIERFHEHGMHVWMDGFGSGRSSITMLREYRLDAIKIDMAFFEHQDDESRKRSRTMLSHFIGISKDLGIRTLVERVETSDQYEFLKGIGCEKVQGFAFAHPMPVGQIAESMEPDCMPPEEYSQRLYYDAVGSVDLLTLATLDEDLGHSMELSSGLPATIVQFCDGKVSYLAWNSSYLDYLRDIGMESIENSTEQMNDLSRPQAQGFHAAAQKMKGQEDWLKLTFYEGEDLCTGIGRCLAVDEEADTSAFIYIAFNISSFLSNAGYTLSI